MVKGAQGLVVSSAGAQFVQEQADEWTRRRRGEVSLVFDSPLLDSSAIGPYDWNRWNRLIEASERHYDGVVIIHGTDTLAFTAGALSFARRRFSNPVVITGSQGGAGDKAPDLPGNLTEALDVAAFAGTGGVAVAFAGDVLAASSVTKASTASRRAFEGKQGRSTSTRCHRSLLARFDGLLADASVAVVTVHPGPWSDALSWAHRPSAVVLRVFGSATVPADARAERRLRDLTAAGVPVVAVTQCADGGVDLSRYGAAGVLRGCGVTGGGAMTTEAAFA